MGEVKVIFGGGAFSTGSRFNDPTAAETILAALQKNGITIIDSAQLYTGSEQLLGELKAGERFTIDTKAVGGFVEGALEEKELVKRGEESMEKLGMKQVDIFYIHMPDAKIPIASTLAGINTLYKKGFFKRFGLSNYFADDVRKIYDHCKEHDYVLPTVYQGNYNPVARSQETKLFPTLRELGIAFYAYSPLAGGFLTKTKDEVLGGKGRFDVNTGLGKMYSGLYAKPTLLEALAEWERVAKEAGCERAELAYRWVKWNSGLKADHGDGIIIGASSEEQLHQTCQGLEKGPLDAKACEAIEEIWRLVEHAAPVDNING